MKKTIRDFDLKSKKVIIRCDFNVPIKDGAITDDNRIVQSLETIKYAIDKGARIILMSHLGKIKSEEDRLENSLKIVSLKLENLLGKKIMFIDKTRGEKLETAIDNMSDGDIILMENTRFEDYPKKLESGNDIELAKYWASLGDIFINDAFGTSHRSHASNVGIATNIPSGIGFLIEKELSNLKVLFNPVKPYTVILGGAKISDKIDVVSALSKKADKIIIGGGMAFTFLKAMGYNIGNSICDEDSIEFASNMLNQYHDSIILPVDVRVTKKFEDSDDNCLKKISDLKDGDIGLDIGIETVELFKKNLEDSKTIFWNGTLGYSEYKNYKYGTSEILDYITKLDTCVILGGGDTVAASKSLGYFDKVTYASTGGGATLDYISGKALPAIEIINNKEVEK